jgi:phage terminase Nu1 subunit (DNA packaging protein)
MSPKPADEMLSKAELAVRLGYGARHIDNLVQDGLPRVRDKRGRWVYPWAACRDHWVARKERAAARRAEPPSAEDARGRLQAAQARMAELDLAVREGQLVAVDLVEREVAELLQRLRARLVTMPSKFAHQLAGVTREEATKRLEEAATEMLLELQRTADDVSPDEEVDDGDRAA